MHVSRAHGAIEKRGTFKTYKEACKGAYLEQCGAVKHAKAALALLMAPASKGEKTSKKTSEKSSKKLLRRLCRRPRKARLWLRHQPQNSVRSTSPTTARLSLLHRLPRSPAKPLLPRCFSSM
jgi:hypothetical protein